VDAGTAFDVKKREFFCKKQSCSVDEVILRKKLTGQEEPLHKMQLEGEGD